MITAFDLNPLSEAIQNVSNHILDYAILVAAVGTIAMALLELFKSVLALRAHYHQVMFRMWIGKNQAKILSEFFVLATGEKRPVKFLAWSPIYDQPSEKFLGQIQAAANVALDYPNLYEHFYQFLTAPPGSSPQQKNDCDLWMAYVKEPPTQKVAGTGSEVDDAQQERARQGSQARARLSNVVARKLDIFQTKLEYFWARGNQAGAVALGTVISFLGMQASPSTSNINPVTLFLLALLGGLMSPFAKDVVSALTGLTTKRG